MHKQRFFPDELKCAKVVSKITTSLSVFYLIYQNYLKVVYINKWINISFSAKFQCDFKQVFSAQHSFSVMVEKMKEIRDSKGVFDTVLTDLSKAFNCILHGSLIPKSNAFNFNNNKKWFISADLYKRKQKN